MKLYSLPRYFTPAALILAFIVPHTIHAVTTSVAYANLPVQNGELVVKNNNYGKGTITGYTSKVWATAPVTDKWTWGTGANWNWPTGDGYVRAYYEMLHGWTGYAYTTNSKLPTWLGANKAINVSWSYSLSQDYSGAYATSKVNAAIDVLLRKDNSGPTAPITGELMVWFYDNGMTPNSKYYKGVVTISGTNYNLYVNPSATNGTDTWPYVAFIRTTAIYSFTNLNLKPFLDYMQTQGWASSGQNIYAVEAGFEVKQGKGEATNYWYSVTIP
jgi:hypothetical protein